MVGLDVESNVICSDLVVLMSLSSSTVFSGVSSPSIDWGGLEII